MEQKQIVYDQIPPLAANHQWIVAQNHDAEDEPEVQIFYSVHDPLHHYRCQIPELLGKDVRGCFYGWVILADHPHNVMWSLWNPVTSKVISFPRLIYDDYIDYCCLTSPPDDPDSVLLMTRGQKPHFVVCRLHPKKKNLGWSEMSYAKQVKKITGEDGFLKHVICCNGKVYARASDFFCVELSIVVRNTGVVINLVSSLEVPDVSINDHRRRSYFVATRKDLCCIYIDFDMVTRTICDVNLFKLDMNSKTWKELENLKDATIFLDIDGYLTPEFHRIGSELGGYIHILSENRSIIYSYHVKDKTISLSSVPCLVGTTNVSTWAMLECKRLLEGDHTQEEDEKDKIVVSKVKSREVEFIGTTDESHLLNLPFDLLETIMAFSVGVEYMNFRASCKLCHFLAPIIQWSNQTALKRLQSEAYSLVSPWLMVFGKHTITLFDPMFGDKYFIKTPPELGWISELKIHCSRYGWLLMRKYGGALFFFNPFTSSDTTHKLPWDPNLQSFDFSAPPTSPNCIVVGFTSLCEHHVHIHFVGRESSWRQYALTFGKNGPDLFLFPAFYGGDVYALRYGKGIDVFKGLGVEDHNWECKRVLDEVPTSSCTSKAQHFLVKCDQHLLLVIVGESGESVEIFTPNEDAGKWEKIDDIGRHMIYIGEKTCLCMEAKTPKMENKIYFPRLHSDKVVFYSFETRKFHTYNGGNVSESFMDFFGTMNHLPHNAWIEPSWS